MTVYSRPEKKPPGARHIRIVPLLAISAATLAVSIGPVRAHADAPGRGASAQFEKEYLSFIIDHHYSALRMTELAAGTDRVRDPAVPNDAEGTSASPGFSEVSAKSADPDIRSMARKANRAQREEIMHAQMMLRGWYGATHTPALNADGREMIRTLEGTPAGKQFDQQFLKTFSVHHLSALHPSLDCQIKSDLAHDKLRRYCDNIVTEQKNAINDMREMLCEKFSVCDFVPSTRGRLKD